MQLYFLNLKTHSYGFPFNKIYYLKESGEIFNDSFHCFKIYVQIKHRFCKSVGFISMLNIINSQKFQIYFPFLIERN